MQKLFKKISFVLIFSMLLGSMNLSVLARENNDGSLTEAAAQSAEPDLQEESSTGLLPVTAAVNDNVEETVAAGDEVVLQVEAEGGSGDFLYRFTGENGKVFRDYSADNTYSFYAVSGENRLFIYVQDEQSGEIVASEYSIVAEEESVGEEIIYDEEGPYVQQIETEESESGGPNSVLSEEVVPQPSAAGQLQAELTSSMTAKEYVDRKVILTGHASGGAGAVEYQFTEVYNGETTIVQAFGTDPDYDFSTTGVGIHTYYVDVRDTEGNEARAEFTMEVVLHPAAALSADIQNSKTSNEYIQREIILTAEPTGGYGDLQYQFTEVYNGTTKVVQPYSDEAVYHFWTSGEGIHTYYVDIKDEEGQQVRASYTMNVVMHPAGVLTGKLTSSKTNNEYIQREVTLTAQPTGGYGDLQYQFTEVYNGTTKVVQPYSDEAVYHFWTSGEGIHTYYVDIKDEEGQQVRASYTMNVVMHPAGVLTGKLTSSRTSNEYIQRWTVLTAETSGGYGDLQYQFTEVYNGTTRVVQEYSSTYKTYEFYTTGPGIHTFYVDIKDEEGQTVRAEYRMNVVIHPSAVLEGNVTNTKTNYEYVWREITLAAEMTNKGYGDLQYQFTEAYNGTTKVVREYSGEESYTFTTKGPGVHTYYIDVKDCEGQTLRLTYQMTVVVHPSYKLSGSLSSNVSNGVAAGNQAVVLTASSSGGYGTQRMYRFRDVYSGQNKVLQNYSSNSSCSFTISGSGVHNLYVDIMDEGEQTVTVGISITVGQVYAYARNVLNQVGWNLQAAFNWSASMPYTRMTSSPSPGSEWFATYGFENGTGNCYVMAATFYYMAQLLGYDVHQVAGYVPTVSGGLTPHSWTEIVINGTVYVFDPNFTNETGRNGYQIRYGTSGTWRYTSYYRMN